jgi:hypothetical protein
VLAARFTPRHGGHGEQASVPADAEVRRRHLVTADAAEVAGWRHGH